MTAPYISIRRRAALAGLVVGPLLLTAGELVQPDSGDGADGMAAAIAQSADAWLIGWTLTMLGAAVILPGLAALSARVGRRGSGLSTAGTILFGAGLLGLVGLAASELSLVPVVNQDAAAAVPILARMNESAALLTIFALYLPGWFFGLPVLLGGLFRARVAPWWSLAAGIASIIVGFVLADTVPQADAVSSVLMLLAFGGVLAHRDPARIAVAAGTADATVTA